VKCETGMEEFVTLYYEHQNSPEGLRRPDLINLYHNSSKIHFNGQIYTHQTLPTLFKTLPASDYRVESWDCQPVAGAVANTQITETNDVACHLMVSGTVTFEGVNLDEASSSRGRGRGRGGFNNYNSRPRKRLMHFTSTFILVVMENQWKIVSETTRLVDLHG